MLRMNLSHRLSMTPIWNELHEVGKITFPKIAHITKNTKISRSLLLANAGLYRKHTNRTGTGRTEPDGPGVGPN